MDRDDHRLKQKELLGELGFDDDDDDEYNHNSNDSACITDRRRGSNASSNSSWWLPSTWANPTTTTTIGSNANSSNASSPIKDKEKEKEREREREREAEGSSLASSSLGSSSIIGRERAGTSQSLSSVDTSTDNNNNHNTTTATRGDKSVVTRVWDYFGPGRTDSKDPLEWYRSGKPTVVMFRGDDKGDQYFLGLVLDVIQPQDSEMEELFHLAKLEPAQEQAQEETGVGETENGGFRATTTTRYLCSPSDSATFFWERRSSLAPSIVPTKLERLPEDMLEESFVIEIESTNEMQKGDDFMSSGRPSDANGDGDIEFYQLDDSGDALSSQTVSVNLKSYDEVVAKCKDLCTRLLENAKLADADILTLPSYVTPWKRYGTENGIEVFTKDNRGSNRDLRCLMGRTQIAASPIEVRHLVRKHKNREKFDPMNQNTDIVKVIDESTAITYFVDKKYIFSREFCILRHEHTFEDGSVSISSNSVNTSLCPNRGFTRALVIGSGYIMIPQGKGSCLMSYLVQTDLKGIANLAPSVVDYILEQQIMSVLRNIHEYFSRDQKF